MRWIALMLLVAVIAAAAVLYGMVMDEGEAGPAPPIAAAPPESAKPTVRPVPDWAANLDRHTPPATAPAIAFTDANGTPLTLASFEGKGVVVNLWATWCGPCVREMPSLDRLQALVAEDGIKVVAVSSDREGMAKVAPFLSEHKLSNLEPYLDPKGEFTRSLPGRGLPRTYILTASGQIAATYAGPAEWDDPALVAAVRELAVGYAIDN